MQLTSIGISKLPHILAVDPGLRGCGYFSTKDQTLLRAAYVKGSAEAEMADA